ncbi:hypothetical protein J3458_009071 [Metarhizium acridum]|uniref:uncharacterized protein n=1 Tax=Metarhizium acridum TaxID=92637 RepID=UPI001C6C9551|nr:hypothetical protein J3458_009071 [Metarhizium acridum]
MTTHSSNSSDDDQDSEASGGKDGRQHLRAYSVQSFQEVTGASTPTIAGVTSIMTGIGGNL